MATTTNQILLERMLPDHFTMDSDLEMFITDCKRFFEMANMSEDCQSLMVKTMMDRNLVPIYEAVEKSVTGFDERLRKAFQKPQTLLSDIQEALAYRKATDSAERFFEKIDRLVDRLLKHKWDKQELTTYLLVHCSDDADIKKEITM